jgi:hypothetical protein
MVTFLPWRSSSATSPPLLAGASPSVAPCFAGSPSAFAVSDHAAGHHAMPSTQVSDASGSRRRSKGVPVGRVPGLEGLPFVSIGGWTLPSAKRGALFSQNRPSTFR